MSRIKTLILGAAGRDFHNFNLVYRQDATYEVVAFTAQQIPHIAERSYPPSLSGPLYSDGIPIYPESRLEELIDRLQVRQCLMSYSDVAHEAVMHLAARCNVAGADFVMLSSERTMLKSRLPVIAVCATRTGAGKSATSREIARILRAAGYRIAVLRHPMPYGDLDAQVVQRFTSMADLDRWHVTIEEREDYEPHVVAGSTVFAGVDYARVVEAAEREADVLIWDGGNNDTSFLAADLYITVADPHRAGHEASYYPGETNVRLADVVIINKVDTALPDDVERVRKNIAVLNPRALILEAESPITVDDREVIENIRVLAIEDGPTVTHGEMKYGAAAIAVELYGGELVDPRPFAVGEIAETFTKYPHLGAVLPAVGYGEQQLSDLHATLVRARAAGVKALAIGTPVDLARVIALPLPHTRVRYGFKLRGDQSLAEMVLRVVGRV
jgi:predicted GTPase